MNRHAVPPHHSSAAVYLPVDGDDFWIVDAGSDMSSGYAGRGRHVDLVLFTFGQWATSQSPVREGCDPDGMLAQGDSDGLCGSWNSASLDNVDRRCERWAPLASGRGEVRALAQRVGR